MCTCYVHAMISSPIEGSPRKFSLIIMLGPYFLGTFEKLRKATSSFVMSVCLSVCISVRPAWNNSAPTGRIFMKIYI